MDRYLKPHLFEFLKKKIVLVMGPRQVGKTTLAKAVDQNFAYYSYDIKKDTRVFLRQEWDREPPLVIFDELHKMRKWKLWLKGLYDDGAFKTQKVLVTGSARLDVARKMGDSLAGRFFSFRLYPLDLKELVKFSTVEKNYQRLLSVSGFPEPFFEGTERYYNIWRKTHLDLILKQDLISFDQIRDLDGIELLVELLSSRVGSTISYKSLAEDLDRDDKTIKRWLRLLEDLYVVFRVSTSANNISRSLKKAGKYYFYDTAKVDGGESQKLENLVALSLKKEIEFQEDVNGLPGKLFFLQTKDKNEIDFLVTQSNRRPRFIEVKLTESVPSRNFSLFERYFVKPEKIQLVKNLHRATTTKTGVRVAYALQYLADLNFV